MQEVLHPGKILHDILMSEGFFYCEDDIEGGSPVNLINYDAASDYTSIDKELLKRFLKGTSCVNYIMAYKLGRNIKGTDMALWLNLQDDYDVYLDSVNANLLKRVVESNKQDAKNDVY